MRTTSRGFAPVACRLSVQVLTLLAANTLCAADFTTTQAMRAQRSQHTATLLPDRTVLVTGGFGDGAQGGYHNSTELYNPANNSWTWGSPMATGRYRHAATLMADGAVMVTGGYNKDCCEADEGYINNAEIYNGSAWSDAGVFGIARDGHTATLLSDGSVLVAGGFNNQAFALNNAHRYVPGSGWSDVGNLQTPRWGHTATLLPNGQVLVTGGHAVDQDFNLVYLSTCELYNPGSGEWSTLPNSMNVARVGHTATLLPNGLVLITAGISGTTSSHILQSAELYNPNTGQWSGTGLLTDRRHYHTATLLPSGRVLAAGGSGSTWLAISSAELYTPWSGIGTWSFTTDSMNNARYWHTATLLADGKVLVAGASGFSAEWYQTYAAHTISWLFPIAHQSLDYLGGVPNDYSAGSGIAYWRDRNRYLVLDNTITPNSNPASTRLFEFNRSHGLLRTINMIGFLDPEDIHLISGDTFVISQERHNFNDPTPDSIDELVVINVPATGTTMNIADAIRRLSFSFTSPDNGGIEAVAVIGTNFYFTTEFAPSVAWSVWWVPNWGNGTVPANVAFSLPELILNRAEDISGMASDGTHLWLLSHLGAPGPSSGRLLKMSTDGRLISDNLLPTFSNGAGWPQAEGLEVFTDPVDNKLKIIITGEGPSNTGADFMLLSAP